MIRKDLHEANRLSWNAATAAHNSHKRDQARFLGRGGSTLFAEERELLGPVAGKRLAHLLCNSGQDTLSLASLGAKVTGVDISDRAIETARALSAESGIPGRFVRADVYDWLEDAQDAGEVFDCVFCSYGALCWVSDLERLTHGVAALLGGGGRFVTVEFHPFAMVFDEDFRPVYPYTKDEPQTWEDGVTDYVARSGDALAPSGYEEGVTDFVNPHPVYEFLWGIGQIVTALSDAGLTVRELREYPYSNGCDLLGTLVEREGRRFYPPDGVASIPLMYSLVAQK